jgi:cell wall-associated NlpC family hydrolase
MRYLGKPWKAGGRGPDAFDCYGLCMDIYQNALGIATGHDFTAFHAHDGTLSEWRKIVRPAPFCVVLMRSCGQAHAGIWLSADHGGVLHCVCGRGVIFTTTEQLRHMPIQIEAYYEHVK